MAANKNSRRRSKSGADPLASLETLDLFDETLFPDSSTQKEPGQAGPKSTEPGPDPTTEAEAKPPQAEPGADVAPEAELPPKPSKTQMLDAMGLDLDALAEETDPDSARPNAGVAPEAELPPKPSKTQMLDAMGLDLDALAEETDPDSARPSAGVAPEAGPPPKSANKQILDAIGLDLDALADETGMDEPLTPLEVNEWLGMTAIDTDLTDTSWAAETGESDPLELPAVDGGPDRPEVTEEQAHFAASLWEEIEASLAPEWSPPDQPEVTEAEADFAQSLWEEMEEAGAFDSSDGDESAAMLSGASNTGDLAVPPSEEPLLASLQLDLDQLVVETLAAETDEPDAIGAPAEAAPTHLRFQQEEVHYAIPLDQLVEISQPLPITWVPNLPPWILGICQLRGDIHSVLDLQLFVTGQQLQVRPDSRFLIVRDGRAELTTALLVDAPLELRALPASSTNPKERRQPDHIDGILDLEGDRIILLNLDTLLEKTVCRQSEP